MSPHKQINECINNFGGQMVVPLGAGGRWREIGPELQQGGRHRGCGGGGAAVTAGSGSSSRPKQMCRSKSMTPTSEYILQKN